MQSTEALLKTPRRGATATFGIVMAVLLLGSFPAWGLYQWWDFRHGLRTDWNIAGPPCPIATRGLEAVTLKRKPQTFDYSHMHIVHAFGGANCSPVPEDYLSNRAYTVCQFTAPVMIEVTAAGRTVLYEPGYGRPATVKLRNGKLSCVLGGWYRD
jgi:hypothetical protein